jgi:hypothetical protein
MREVISQIPSAVHKSLIDPESSRAPYRSILGLPRRLCAPSNVVELRICHESTSP